jgi:FKBP-type peptidyl-prolyl cis-trans isomerase
MKTAKWIALLGVGLLAAQASAEEATVLKTPKDMTSYSMGLQSGRHFRTDEIDVDVGLFVKGLKDGLSGEKPLLSEKDLRKVMNGVLGEVRRKEAANRRLAMEENRKKSEAFLAENKTKEGVVTLPSGIQYKVLKAGDGKKPTDTDVVEVNYRGTLLDGTEFDATDPGKPATFKLSQAIPGWRQALKLMPAGSRWQVFIPPELAYGARGAGSDIGPNEALVFEVELVAVK